MRRIMIRRNKSKLLNRLTTGYSSVFIFAVLLCAAEMSIRLTLLVLSGTLAAKATGGRRGRLLRLQTRTTSSLIQRSTRRMKVIATSVAPSAAFDTSRFGADLSLVLFAVERDGSECSRIHDNDQQSGKLAAGEQKGGAERACAERQEERNHLAHQLELGARFELAVF